MTVTFDDDDSSSFGIACRAFDPVGITDLDRSNLYRGLIAYLHAEGVGCREQHLRDAFLRRAAELEVEMLKEEAGRR